jgi:hypothetical protein
MELKNFIAIQKKIARDLRIDFIEDIIISPLKNKKYRVILSDGKKIDYGAAGMEDYLIHKDEERRDRFHKRFKNNKGYNDRNSGLYYSARLLWN